MRHELLIATGMSFAVSLASVSVSRAEPGACCHRDACLDVTDPVDCQVYTCNVTDLLPETFGGCYGDADGNGFVNPGDRATISANIGQAENPRVCLYDLDGNGVINPGDRGFVAANIDLCAPLPDYQDGSGLNGGVPDPRYPAPTFNVALTCEQVTCCAEPLWTAGFAAPGLNDNVLALTDFDDGTGPALYAGGEFSTAGGVAANRIAKWDGTGWSPLAGPSGNGIIGRVNALTAFDDGTGPALYAGGGFTTAGGVTANCIAKWNGTAWSPLSGPNGNGMSSDVLALTVFDDGTGPALYAGGFFTAAGGVAANRIAKWNGTAWSPLAGPSGNGILGSVFALTVFDDGTGPALYAGGFIATAGGVTANRIAKWDGTQWSALAGPSGNGMNNLVSALTPFDDGTGPALYAGGFFTTAGGVAANRIAKWDGTAWSPLAGPSGNGMNNPEVAALTVFDRGTGPALYATGGFTTAGGVAANRIAKWDGTAWSPLAGPSGNGMNNLVSALTPFDDGTGPALYAGGSFLTAGGVQSVRVARWGCAP